LGTTGDYQMNKGNFEKWLTEHLFPNIPSGCVIIMDNAPYHSERMNKPPVKSSTKKTVVECLIKNNILRVHDSDLRKCDLAHTWLLNPEKIKLTN
jgi:hypothetical protein